MSEWEARKVPQIRFKGSDDAWEKKKLSEVADVYDGTHQTPDYTKEGVMFLSVENIRSLKSNKFISEKAFEEGFKVFPQKGDILMTRIGDIGTPNVVESNERIAYYVSLALLKLKGLDPYFLKQSIFSNSVRKELWHRTLHIAFPKKINKNEIEKVVISLPQSRPEQTQIGEYFHELDSLIGLHQRKHDKLVALKKAMLQKMFPQPGATTPEIRFKGSSGEWAQKKLGEVMANIANNTLSRANLNDHSGLARNIHYGDILVRFGEVLDVQSDGVPFVSDDAVVKKLMFSNLENGDIVLADAAEDEIVGKCTEIHNVGDQIVLAGLHTIPLRPLLHFAPFYLGYYLNSDGYHDQLLPIMQGTKVLSISKSAIKQTSICFPVDEAEQEKIGSYFRTLDELISQHAIQLQKLQQIKSACLEKMFV